LLQIVMQIWLFLRNSGIVFAIQNKLLALILQRVAPPKDKGPRKKNPDEDPLLTLQYLAAFGIQYDFADLCALLLSLFMILFFIWRDGWFTLHGTGLLVKSEQMGTVVFRFVIIAILKLLAGFAARTFLMRSMRKTLLGQKTMHGRSDLAHEILASHAMVKGGNAAARANKIHETHLRKNLSDEEHIKDVRRELSLKNLDYRVFSKRFLKRFGPFLMCCMAFELFACFPVCRIAPVDYVDHPSDTFQKAAEIAKLAENNYAPGINASQVAFNTTYIHVPSWLVWMYVPPSERIAFDYQLNEHYTNFPEWSDLGWARRGSDSRSNIVTKSGMSSNDTARAAQAGID